MDNLPSSDIYTLVCLAILITFGILLIYFWYSFREENSLSVFMRYVTTSIIVFILWLGGYFVNEGYGDTVRNVVWLTALPVLVFKILQRRKKLALRLKSDRISILKWQQNIIILGAVCMLLFVLGSTFNRPSKVALSCDNYYPTTHLAKVGWPFIWHKSGVKYIDCLPENYGIDAHSPVPFTRILNPDYRHEIPDAGYIIIANLEIDVLFYFCISVLLVFIYKESRRNFRKLSPS